MPSALLRQNRNFRLHFIASVVSNLGDGVSVLAMPWLATLLTRDPFLISLVVTGGRLPWFLFSLPAGVWTDRADRRRMMVRADLVRTALTLLVIALILSVPALPQPAGAGPGPILALAGLSFLLGTAEVLRDNAAQTLMPQIVAPADLERANGQMWSAEQVMNQFIGPPLAGALIGLGIAVPFGLDAATFAMAAALIAMLNLPAQILPPRRAFLSELREGLVWLKDHALIRRLAIILGITNAVFTAAITMLALYSQEILGLGAFGHGLLLTAGAAGGVMAGLSGPWIAARFGPERAVHAAMIIFAASYLILGRRVNAVYRFLGWGMMPIGAVAGGLMVRFVEPLAGREAALTLPFLIAGTVTVTLTVYGFFRLRFPEEKRPGQSPGQSNREGAAS